MSKKYLFVGVVCIAIALLCIAALATASETTVSAVVVSEGAGYDAGAGLQAEWLKRWDRFGLDFSGDILAQKKHSADSGYKWGVDGQARWYPAGDWYLGAGAAWTSVAAPA